MNSHCLNNNEKNDRLAIDLPFWVDGKIDGDLIDRLQFAKDIDIGTEKNCKLLSMFYLFFY